MEVPKLGVKTELQLPAYTIAIATATLDLSCICDLHHSSQQCWILTPPHPEQGRAWNPNLMVPSRICFL